MINSEIFIFAKHGRGLYAYPLAANNGVHMADGK